MNPTYAYEPARVDINSKGKIRARAVNLIQPSKVDLVSERIILFKKLFNVKYLLCLMHCIQVILIGI